MIELNQWSNGDYYFKLFVVVVKKIERINYQRKRIRFFTFDGKSNFTISFTR